LTLKARVFLWLTLIAGGFVSYWYLPLFDYTRYHPFIVGFLALFAFFAEIYEIEILPKHKISVSTAIYMSFVYIGGAPIAIAVSLPSLFFSEIIIRGFANEASQVTLQLRKIFFNTSQVIVSLAVSSIVFKLVGGQPPPFNTAYAYLPPVLAFFSFMFVNISLVSGIISLSEGQSFFYHLKINIRDLPVQYLSLIIISILIAITYSASPWNVFLVTILLILANTSVHGYIQLQKEAKQTFEKMMDLLSKRDPYTHEHSESVGDLTEAIAEEMKIPPERKENIVSAARVHDIGKLGIPDSILLKKGSLTEEEWETMKEHPVIGADILSGLTIYEDSVDVVRYEHERWDGSGYPEGLEGEEIPIGSRIVAVADVWNALRTERPYRGPLSKKKAREEIEQMSGVKLDPEIVNILLSVVDSGQVEVKS